MSDEEKFRSETIRLLAAKYAYYELSRPLMDDYSYDMAERDWHALGKALGHLSEEDTSPCVDWDPKHPLAPEALKLASQNKYLV